MQTETIEITGFPPGTKSALEAIGYSCLGAAEKRGTRGINGTRGKVQPVFRVFCYFRVFRVLWAFGSMLPQRCCQAASSSRRGHFDRAARDFGDALHHVELLHAEIGLNCVTDFRHTIWFSPVDGPRSRRIEELSCGRIIVPADLGKQEKQ